MPGSTKATKDAPVIAEVQLYTELQTRQREVIADTLLGAGCINTNMDCMEEELSCAVRMTVALYSTCMIAGGNRSNQKRQHQQSLRQIVQSEWPDNRTQVLKEV